MLQPERMSIYNRYVPALQPEPGREGPAYWFIIRSNLLLVQEEPDSIRIPLAPALEAYGIEPVRTQYLGTYDGVPCYSVEAPAQAEAPEGMSFTELRGLYGAMEEDLFHLAGRAVQIVAWDQTNQFCGRCGAHTVDAEGDRAKVCPECGFVSYPRISPAVITVILKDNKLLLAHAKHFRNNMYGLIAGFVEPGETLEDCVRRETLEEVGIQVTNIRYYGSQQWPFPNSLMIGFIADYESGEITVDGEEIVDAAWFEPDRLPVIPTPVSIARKMIDWYVSEYGGGNTTDTSR